MLLFVVMLSVGAAFAEDNITDELAADETSTDSLTLDEEVDVVSDSKVVTNDTFYNYFDESGTILDNVSDDELTFNGDFENIGVNTITLNKTVKLTGDNVTLNNIALDIKADNVVISGFTIINNNATAAISVNNATGVEIEDTSISFTAVSDADGYAIYANAADSLKLLNNIITYTGTTAGTGINNGIYVNSNNAQIKGNKFILSLVSSYVSWVETPAGSWNYVAFPLSEGVVVSESENVTFDENNVTAYYNSVVGTYDTIYTVSFKDSDNAVVTGNNIYANGYTYIYGIQMNGENFNVSDNSIISISDIYYANGIDIEGPATGVVESNTIYATGVSSAYPIYSGMNGQNTTVDYINNAVYGDAYFVIGMSLGDVESNVMYNYIDVTGNYTVGIASNGNNILIESNNITEVSSQTGNESIWDSFGVDASAIKVLSGDAEITTNNIVADGKGIVVEDATVNINNNALTVTGDSDNDAYAIYAENITDLYITGNEIVFSANTTGTAVNNGIYVSASDKARIQGNEFNLSLVSCYVPWIEIPAGSWNYVAFPVSEGVVISESDNVTFENNKVNVDYIGVSGSYDTIYSVNFKDSDNAQISENTIISDGHTYIYGIQMNGENFNISNNTISSSSDNYYANGIDIEGSASGVVENNIIFASGVSSAYPIYSGMNGQNVSVDYIDNYIVGQGYLVIGMSLGDIESYIGNNDIYTEGNYTTGIASVVKDLIVENNNITEVSSQIGNESMWESFGVDAAGIKVYSGDAEITTNNIVADGKGIVVEDATANINNNNLTVTGDSDNDAYAVYADTVTYLVISGNYINYTANTTGSAINNGVYVSESDDAIIQGNTFDLYLVSSYVPWSEVPSGSGNWVSSPVSEGIVVCESDDVIFADNIINTKYTLVSGYYDTIYTLSFKDCDDAVISENNITADGHTYIYGIQITGDNFTIDSNTITVSSDNYYANGIDIEGPATGVVKNNNLSATGVNSAYVIYSGMNGADVNATYINNTIKGDAYNVFGLSLGDVESDVEGNIIILDGNYTTGIAHDGSKITIVNNIIYASGSNIGNESIWESFGVETVGIKLIGSQAYVSDNTVMSSSNYTIISTNAQLTLMNNDLYAANTTGSASVKITPTYKTILSAADLYMVYDSGDVYYVILKDENNNPLENQTISLSVNGDILTETTDSDGVASFVMLDIPVGEYDVVASYAGDDTYGSQSIDGYIMVQSRGTEFSAASSMSVLLTSVKSGSYYTLTLKDNRDNGIGNATVKITFNGKTANYVTDELGVIKYKLTASKAGTQKLTMVFNSDSNYVESEATATIKITKEATKLTASKKTFKVKAKNKKYTVTLKNSKGKAINKVKVTLKVKGKTYKATTNSKGKATFNLKKLTKAGRFTAKIKFAANTYYKASSKSVKITVKK